MIPSPASLNHRGTKNLLSGLGAIDPEVTLLQLVINKLIHAARFLTRRCNVHLQHLIKIGIFKVSYIILKIYLKDFTFVLVR